VSYGPLVRRALTFTLSVMVLAAACAGAKPKTTPGKTSGTDQAKPRAVSSSIPEAVPSSTATPTVPSKQTASSGACPSGMALVDGEYCSEVEHSCKRSWYDKSNRKTVCEEFEPISKCVGEKSKKRFCMDHYTWPNQKGARPEVMNRFHQAELKCAAVGKRLCTETEWSMACEGPKLLPFPYGYVRDTKKCHGDMEWDGPDMKKVAARDPTELARLWKGKRNGSQPECVSDYGVYDLPGNVDEVVSSESFHLPGYKGKFDSVHTGGPWYKGTRNQCRPKIYTHDEAFYYYFLGFRCCAEPDGKATDPRTPYQIEKKWKLERVERSAGFTLTQMKGKLELIAKNQCTCGNNDILCKTMCGTLLGPEAKDHP
jgi:formylglycine-generating enzyme